MYQVFIESIMIETNCWLSLQFYCCHYFSTSRHTKQRNILTTCNNKAKLVNKQITLTLNRHCLQHLAVSQYYLRRRNALVILCPWVVWQLEYTEIQPGSILWTWQNILKKNTNYPVIHTHYFRSKDRGRANGNWMLMLEAILVNM